MDVGKTLAVLLLFTIAVSAILVISGVIYVNIAVGISMQPFIETSAVIIGVDPDFYYQYLADYFGYNLTGKMIVYTAFGDMTYMNLQTGETVTIHFIVPTPIAHQVYLDKGEYLIVRGSNNGIWAEIVPKNAVEAIILAVIDLRLALALAFLLGIATTLAVLKLTDKI